MQRGRAGLEWIFWGWLVDRGVGLAMALYTDWLIRQLVGSTGPRDDLFEQLRLLNLMSLVIGCVGSVAIVVGLTRLVRAWPVEARIDGPARTALWTAVALLVDEVAAGLLALSGSGASPLFWQINVYVHLVLAVVFAVSLWSTLRRVLVAVQGRAPDWIAAAFLAHIVLMVIGPLLRAVLSQKALPGASLLTAASVLAAIGVLAGIHRAARALRQAGLPLAVADVPDDLGAAGAAPLPGPGWDRALTGLEGYRGAVIAKVVLLVAGATGLALAAATRSPELGKVILVAMPGVDFVIGVFLVSGLVGYAAVPDESGARTTAQLGAASAVVTLLVQVYVAYLLVVLLGERNTYEARHHAERTLPMAQLATQVLGLGGMLLLLASFRALAVSLARTDVVARTGAVSAGAVVTMVAAVVLQLARPSAAAPLVVGGLVVLVVAIATLVGYLAILRELTSELRARLARAP